MNYIERMMQTALFNSQYGTSQKRRIEATYRTHIHQVEILFNFTPKMYIILKGNSATHIDIGKYLMEPPLPDVLLHHTI